MAGGYALPALSTSFTKSQCKLIITVAGHYFGNVGRLEFMIQDARFKMQDAGSRIQDAKSIEHRVRVQMTEDRKQFGI